MEFPPRALCVSLGARGVASVRDTVAALSGAVRFVELRADLLPLRDLEDGSWESLAGSGAREWVFTWRSPEEGGGGGDRPAGLLTRAQGAGFAWIDVEGSRLASGDSEALAVSPERRWVSAHLALEPEDAGALKAAWIRLRSHEGALHKLVTPTERFDINTWCLDLLRDERSRDPRPATIFAMGRVGHPSRILGALGGNAVTYVAPSPDENTAPGQPDLGSVLDLYGLPALAEDTPIYGVLGFGIRHSKSPYLHNHAFRRTGVAGLYLRLESPEPGPVIKWLREGRLRGLSVTSPHKKDAASVADVRDPAVDAIGAANTLWMEGDTLHAANTDAFAAAVLLGELGLEPGQAVAVLGAGGAAAAVISAAESRGAKVSVFNRGVDRGRGLAAEMGARWAGGLEGLDPARFAVVVNATPLGRDFGLPPFLEERDWTRTSILDLAYGPRPTAWERLAAREGILFRGGLLFLAIQGAEQFRIWTGHRIEAERFAEGLHT